MQVMEAIKEDAYTIGQTAYYHTIELQVRPERAGFFIESLANLIQSPGFMMIEMISPPGETSGGRYYLNGLQTVHFLLLFDMYRDLLISETGVRFGFGAHEGVDQIFIHESKRISIYTESPDKFVELLQASDVCLKDQLQQEAVIVSVPARKNMTIDGDTLDLMIETMQLYGLVRDQET